jgi:hypothetical protein
MMIIMGTKVELRDDIFPLIEIVFKNAQSFLSVIFQRCRQISIDPRFNSDKHLKLICQTAQHTVLFALNHRNNKHTLAKTYHIHSLSFFSLSLSLSLSLSHSPKHTLTLTMAANKIQVEFQLK